ncbi:MAG: response regulator [Polaromonas sp.]
MRSMSYTQQEYIGISKDNMAKLFQAFSQIDSSLAREAITLAQLLRPDLIVLDLLMPGINGFEVVQALQRNADTTRIPILVVTAKEITAQDCDALHSQHGSIIHVTSKASFNRSQFLDEVRRALQAH